MPYLDAHTPVRCAHRGRPKLVHVYGIYWAILILIMGVSTCFVNMSEDGVCVCVCVCV